ncbi:MAG: NAD(P)H-dependent oxidoreductase [Bacteroides sp.]|nr:NAD(P)H-dependent oxidoreductase [Bacteroides sp.]
MDSQNKILIQLYHPLLHKSRVNRELLKAIKDLDGVDIRIMYDLYPDFHIDVKEEQRLLQEYDIIIWQHPFYWYSSPSLLKEWIDVVLEHGFAYGREGKALEGKMLMTCITSGGRREVYQEGGMRKYTIRQLLAPFEQTATLCNMNYLPPFVVHGTHLLDIKGIIEAGEEYRRVLIALRDGTIGSGELAAFEYTNDFFS